MKFITKLEQSKSFWFLLIISLIFFLLRLPSVIEPYWYGDEGIYEVIGQALRSGRLLYTQIWDNKPPLLYLVYALFNGDQSNVKLISLIVGLATTMAFFSLAKNIVQNTKVAMIITGIFAILFATPFIEGNIANAENFMLLPTILAGLLIYTQKKGRLVLTSLLAGLLLGVAFLFKTVAIFDTTAFILFLLIINDSARIKKIVLLSIGFILPMLLAICVFTSLHTLNDFIAIAFLGNISYVGENNLLLIPQGLVLLKLLLLLVCIGIIFWKRQHIQRNNVFVLLWLALSTFNAFFSQRPYTHYLLVLLPSFCLMIGICLITSRREHKLTYAFVSLILCCLLATHFSFFGVTRSVQYYKNALLFLTGAENIATYQTFFDQKTPRDYQIAYFITTHIKPSDQIFIWSDRAQIYALTHKFPPGRFTTAYHINENEANFKETQQILRKADLHAIIILAEAPNFPFTIPFPTKTMLLNQATIYEKNY